MTGRSASPTSRHRQVIAQGDRPVLDAARRDPNLEPLTAPAAGWRETYFLGQRPAEAVAAM